MSTIELFNFSTNILRSLLWRHNKAVNLQALLQNKQDFFDVNSTDFWTDWVVDVFDLQTANDFGLHVWSIILGLNITIEPSTLIPNSNFGFGAFRKNFNNGNFTSASGDIVLTTEDARTILRLRYYQLTTNGNVIDINLAMADVFGVLGLAYVVDNLDMTIEYVFEFALNASTLLALLTFDVLPRPAGVGLTITVTP